jgi:hypothetical protein
MDEELFYTDAGDHDIPVINTPRYIIGFGLIPKDDFVAYAKELIDFKSLEDIEYDEDHVIWGTIDWFDVDTLAVTPGQDWEVTYIERF